MNNTESRFKKIELWKAKIESFKQKIQKNIVHVDSIREILRERWEAEGFSKYFVKIESLPLKYQEQWYKWGQLLDKWNIPLEEKIRELESLIQLEEYALEVETRLDSESVKGTDTEILKSATIPIDSDSLNLDNKDLETDEDKKDFGYGELKIALKKCLKELNVTQDDWKEKKNKKKILAKLRHDYSGFNINEEAIRKSFDQRDLSYK